MNIKKNPLDKDNDSRSMLINTIIIITGVSLLAGLIYYHREVIFSYLSYNNDSTNSNNISSDKASSCLSTSTITSNTNVNSDNSDYSWYFSPSRRYDLLHLNL